MARFKVVVEAYVASRELDQASLSRLAFWVDVLGDKEIAAISADDIDAALLKLAERGRLKAGRRMRTAASGKPLAGSTINRYLTQAGSVFKHAKRLKRYARARYLPVPGLVPLGPLPEEIQRGFTVRKECQGSGPVDLTVLDTISSDTESARARSVRGECIAHHAAHESSWHSSPRSSLDSCGVRPKARGAGSCARPALPDIRCRSWRAARVRHATSSSSAPGSQACARRICCSAPANA